MMLDFEKMGSAFDVLIQTASPHTIWFGNTQTIILVVACLCYYLCPRRTWQNVILLFLGFDYAWHISRLYSVVLFGSGFIEWIIATRIHASDSEKTRTRLILASVAMNIVVLVGLILPLDKLILAVLPFLSGSHAGRAAAWLFTAYVVNSFFIFSKMSLSLDAYNRRMKFSPPLLDSMAFIGLFSRSWGNPMDRARDTMPQLAQPRTWSWTRFEYAAWLLLFGTTKYAVSFQFGDAPDRLMDLQHSSGLALLLGAWVYTIHFWLFFSGTIDISRGLSSAFGLHIAPNFNAPFAATNIADFWRRWNISFGNWLYEEIFSRIHFNLRNFGNWGAAAACLGTFLVSGLAHGLDWSVATWTIIQGGSIFLYFVFRTKIRGWAKRRGNPRWIPVAGWFVTVHLFVLPLALGSFEKPSEVALGAWRLVSGPIWPGEAVRGDILRCLLVCGVAIVLHTVPQLHFVKNWLRQQGVALRMVVAIGAVLAILLSFGWQ